MYSSVPETWIMICFASCTILKLEMSLAEHISINLSNWQEKDKGYRNISVEPEAKYLHRKSRTPYKDDPFQLDYDCSDRYANSIIGGEEVVPFSMPWVAYIKTYFKGMYKICAGTLISRQWIVTAAHCVKNGWDNASKIFTFLGIHEKGKCEQEKQIKYRVANFSNVFVHAMFNPIFYSKDLALIKLTPPLPDHPHIRPACLPVSRRRGPRLGEICVAAGWGVTFPGGDIPSKKLMNIEVAVKRCDGDEGETICTGRPPGVREIQDTCVGDSGGPLICTVDKVQTLIGVLSTGSKGCNDPENQPARYRRVSAFMDWMQANMQEN